MKHLIPYFIQQQAENNHFQGSFQAYTLFMDLSGFTAMTEELMARGNEGAEALSRILNKVFSPMVRLVYQQKGVIPYFAGDSFTAIFPVSEIISPIQILEIAQGLIALPTENQYAFEGFTIGLKIGMSFGKVEWGIVGDEYRAFYFRGEAIDQCAMSQIHAQNQEIILDKQLKVQLSSHDFFLTESIYPNYYLLDCPKLKNNLIDQSIELPSLNKIIARQFLPKSIINYQQAGEFRTVVSLFISFTELHTHDAIGIFISIVLEEIHNFSGYFKEIDFGDKGGVLALFFGAPISFENNVERALEFVTTVRERLKILRDNSDFKYRIGITSGTAFTGIVGGQERCQYSVVGSRVNLAARLMTYANWGEVLVDREIQKNRQFKFKSKGNIRYKGVIGEIPTYALRGKNSEYRLNFNGIMIGRDVELTQLIDFAEPILEHQSTGVAFIYGEAGIGKSRLCYELQQHLYNQHKISWFTCQTDQILKKPFNAFVYLLKTYFEQSTENTPHENKQNFERVYQWLLSQIINRTHDEATRLEHELIRTKSILAALLGIYSSQSLWEQLDAKGRYENIITALTSFFLATSLYEPAVIFIEDGHWLDNNSKELLSNLIKKMGQYPILILITSRYLDDGSKPIIIRSDLQQKTNHITINLNTLSTKALEAFAVHRLGSPIDRKFLQVLINSTNCNPFYLEQVLEYFIESDELKQVDGVWFIKDSQIKLTTSIHTILMARIDRLSSLVKETVKAAAVIGREFELPVLSEILKHQSIFATEGDDPIKALKEQVKTAEKGQIWQAVNELRYMFQHALLREAAYDMQLGTRLRELHQLIGQAIEKLYINDLEVHYMDLAFHYEQAKNIKKTRIYLEKAADYAHSNYQNRQAIDFYNKLLNLHDEEENTDTVFNILLKKGSVQELIGDWEDSAKHYKKALSIALRWNNHLWIAEASSALGHLEMMQGDNLSAKKHLEQSSLLFELSGKNNGLSKVYGNLGALYFRQGNYEIAKEKFLRSIAISDSNQGIKTNAQIVANLGVTYMNQGLYEEGISCQLKQLRIASKANDKQALATLYTYLGIVYMERGTPEAALRCHKKGYKLSDDLGNKHLKAINLGCLGGLYQGKGDYEQALQYFLQDLELCEEIGDKQGNAIALGLLGELYSQRGEFDKAISYLQKQLLICKEISYQKGIAKALNTLGDVYFFLKIYTRSLHFYDQAIELTKRIDNKLVLGMSLAEKTIVLLAINELEKAQATLKEAQVIADMLANPTLVFLCKLLTIKSLRKKGQIQAAIKALQLLTPLTEQSPEQQAEVLYEQSLLYSNSHHNALKALNLYQTLYQKTPKHSFKMRIDSLTKRLSNG